MLLTQVLPVPHAVPQAPQLLLLVVRSTHWPAQFVVPVGRRTRCSRTPGCRRTRPEAAALLGAGQIDARAVAAGQLAGALVAHLGHVAAIAAGAAALRVGLQIDADREPRPERALGGRSDPHAGRAAGALRALVAAGAAVAVVGLQIRAAVVVVDSPVVQGALGELAGLAAEAAVAEVPGVAVVGERIDACAPCRT